MTGALKICLLGLLVGVLGACAGRRNLVFLSEEPGSQLALVPLDSPDSEGTRLKNPASVDLGQLRNKSIRISAPGKASQYWFAPQDQGPRLQVKIKRLGSCEGQEGNRNRPLRLILRAYQSLYARDYPLARDLAGKAAVLDATLAAPHIITGLCWLKEGERTKAVASFNQALALDPEDSEIAALLRAAQ